MASEQDFFWIIIENLKRFPYDKFNVRDLFGDEDEWFKTPLKIRQELGMSFYNYINKCRYIKKSSEHLKVLTGATVYEDTRFEVDIKNIMYVEDMQCKESSIHLSLKKVRVYYLDKENSNINEYYVHENDTKTYNLSILGFQYNAEILPTPNYIQLNKTYSKKLFSKNNFSILINNDRQLNQYIYFLKSFPNDEDTVVYYNLIGIQYIDELPSFSGVSNPKLNVCNVGQANFMYIESEEKNLFFDAGYPSKKYRNSENIFGIVKYMNNTVKKGDIAFLSHWHDDHYSIYNDMNSFDKFQYFVAPFPDTLSINLYLNSLSVKGLVIPAGVDNFLQKNKTKTIFVSINQLSLTKTHKAILNLHQTIPVGTSCLEIYKTFNYRFNYNRGVLYYFYNDKGVLFTGDSGNFYVNGVLKRHSKIDIIIYPHHGGSAGRTILNSNFDELVISHGNSKNSIYKKIEIRLNYSSKKITETYDPKYHTKEPNDIKKWAL